MNNRSTLDLSVIDRQCGGTFNTERTDTIEKKKRFYTFFNNCHNKHNTKLLGSLLSNLSLLVMFKPRFYNVKKNRFTDQDLPGLQKKNGFDSYKDGIRRNPNILRSLVTGNVCLLLILK